MTDYGKGGILGTATTLPATSALGLAFIDKLHPVLLVSFMVITLVSLIITFGYITRYLTNKQSLISNENRKV